MYTTLYILNLLDDVICISFNGVCQMWTVFKRVDCNPC